MGRDTTKAIIGYVAAIAVPICLVLDSAVALAQGWTPPDVRYWPAIVLVLLFLVLGLSVLAAAPLFFSRGRRFYASKVLHFAMANSSIMFALIAIEGLSVNLIDRWAFLHRRPSSWHKIFRPHDNVLPGATPEAHYTTNSLGIRGPEFPPTRREYRILCVGGSTTECVYLDDLKSWPHLLMKRLNKGDRRCDVWIGNVGISGYSTVEHLHFVEKSRLMGEVDCVLLLVGFNDGGLALTRSSGFGPAPIWYRSQFLYMVKEVVRRRRQRQTVETIDTSGTHIVLRRQRREQAGRIDQLPDLTQALVDYKERILKIAQVCKNKGIRCIFMTQPVLWDSHLSPGGERLLWLGETLNGDFLTIGRLRDGLESYNSVLRSACTEVCVPCIELSSMSGNPEYFFDDCHFSEAGAREISRLVGERLLQLGW